MKKLLAVTISILLMFTLVALTGCDNDSLGTGDNTSTPPTNTSEVPNNGGDDVTNDFDSTDELAIAIVAEANSNIEDEMDSLPTMTEDFPNEFVAEEDYEEIIYIQLGITMEQFENYVVSVSRIMNMIGLPQEVFVFETESAADATTLAGLIANGFNPRKWICMSPDFSLVIHAGNYVLLASGTSAQQGAIAPAFNKVLGVNATPNVFFEWDGDQWWGDDEGGMGFPGFGGPGGLDIDPDGDGGLDIDPSGTGDGIVEIH